MKNLKKLLFLFIILSIASCAKQELQITDKMDYDIYLKSDINSEKIKIQSEHSFWSKKLKDAPDQYPYLSKIATAESNLFEITGEITYLISAEKNLIKTNERTNYSNANYLRALARNFISQHRFKEALVLLEKAEANGERLVNTKKMLFDVHLELGNFKKAQNYLEAFKNEVDFDYLIRLSKWNDHQGHLKSAIIYMEKATALAEQANNPSLKQWSYTNLADFYGHANRIEDSYQYYLKALALNPNDAYAKKGIAWIVYSHEKNAKEALAILNRITKQYDAPDYYLLKAEIAEYINDTQEKNKNINSYMAITKNDDYGSMYNKYNTLLYAEELNDVDNAIKIAKKEVALRPTPQSYDLLAWSYYHKGQLLKALNIVQKNIVDKTFEPEVQYHIAKIYKANGMEKQANKIKKELLESAYELGPLMEAKIQLI